MAAIPATDRGSLDDAVTGDTATTGRERVAAAARDGIARDGVRAVTVERVAAEAGVGRASIYRWFPGGREEVLLAAGLAELDRFLDEVEPRLAAAPTLDDALAHGLATTVRFLRTSPVLASVMAHEPELVLPHLAFDRMDTAFDVAAGVAVRHLTRFLDERDARRAAELVARLALSHALNPSADLDAGDPDAARRLVSRFITPGLAAQPTR